MYFQVEMSSFRDARMMLVDSYDNGVISPTLFNVHINDLGDAVPNHVNIDKWKYAGDCTQYQIVERGTCSTMQEAFAGLSERTNCYSDMFNHRIHKLLQACL